MPVIGTGTAGTSATGVVTIQGIAGGTAIPVSGSITDNNPSVSATGAAVPADGTFIGLNSGGNLIGAIGDSSGRAVVVGAGTAGSAAGGVLTVQGSASGTAIPVSGTVAATQSGTWSTRTQDGTGNAITSTGAALDVNIKTSSITASDNVAQFGGNNVVTGTGPGGVGIPRVTVSNDSTVGLVAGSAIVGKVGIDQTTPGTTNAVSNTNFPSTADVNNGVAGASTIRIAEGSHAITSNILANNPYASTNVTTGAYVQLIASTASALNLICLSNSSGSIIKLATGAAASEVDRVYIPGGGSGCWPVNIAASTRVSIEALDATASTGYFTFTGML
jgi:hypothetical protein